METPESPQPTPTESVDVPLLKPKQVRNVLLEYRNFERSLGMQNVDLLTLT